MNANIGIYRTNATILTNKTKDRFMLSEKSLQEINKELKDGDITLCFRLRLKIDKWGSYNKGDVDTFYIKLLDKKSGLAKYAIGKQWDVVSCELINDE